MGVNGNGADKDFWTAKEAAGYLRIHVATLYCYCRQAAPNIPVPPHRRIGRNLLRFPIIEFKEWASRFDHPGQER